MNLHPYNGSTSRVYAVWQAPFALGTPNVETWAHGVSLETMVDQMQCLPKHFEKNGTIRINDIEAPKALWGVIKPKPATPGDPIIVTMHISLHGGKQTGKAVFALIAAIATAGLSTAISAGSFAVGNLFAAGTLSAKLLAGAVSLIGALVVGALTAPPAVASADAPRDQKDLGAASAVGNVLEPNGPIPRVVGTRRIFPPLAFDPIIETVGQDEIVEAVYVLAGPHKLEDIRLGDSAVDLASTDITDITIETREGTAEDNADLLLNNRIGRTIEYNTKMTVHNVDAEDQSKILSISRDVPVWHGVGAKKDLDELWIALLFQGLVQNANATDKLRVPFRLRMKLRGTTTWRNLPELHFSGNSSAAVRTQIKIFFGELGSTGLNTAPTTLNFVEARKHVDGQVLAPPTSDWDADAYFSDGAGDDSYRNGTEGSTNVKNVQLTSSGAEIYLDDASWPSGIYDIEILRGAILKDADYAPATYLYDSVLWDFFAFQGSGDIPLSREGILDDVVLARSSSIWNQVPLNQKNLALISLKAKNRQVDKLSVIASGYVNDLGAGRPIEPNTRDLVAINGDIILSADLDTSNDFFVAIDTIIPDSPSGIIWEQGGSSDGLYFGFDGSNVVFRVGDGVGAPATDTAYLEFANTDLVGKTVTFYLAFDISAKKVQLWSWDHNEALLTDHGTDIATAAITVWAGPADGAIGTSSGTVAGNTTHDVTDFNGIISEARFYNTQWAPTTVTAPDDTVWNRFHTTSNPAAWYRDVLTGNLNFNPLPETLLDDDGLSTWHSYCEKKEYTCDLIAQGLGLAELTRIIASCGYARPYQSDIWGITQDKRRTDELPVQLINARNSKDFSWARAFPRLPAGLRVNYNDILDNYETRQVDVFRTEALSTSSRMEQTTYEGFVDETKTIQRAQFDIEQASKRATFYSLTMPLEWIRCRRGSLVGVTYDILNKHVGQGRITQVNLSGADIASIVLDAETDLLSEGAMDTIASMSTITDMSNIGAQSGIVIREDGGGVNTYPISNVTARTDTITFSPVLVGTNIAVGNLVTIGPMDQEYKRLLVTDITPKEDHEAVLTLVDEAPELWDIFGLKNLNTYSEELNNTDWFRTGTSITANALAAPDGTTTADELIEDTSTGEHFTRSKLIVDLYPSTYVQSIYVHDSSTRDLTMRPVHLGDTSNTSQINFDISAKTFSGQAGNAIDWGYEDIGGGWLRVWLAFTTTIITGIQTGFQCFNASTVYLGDGSSGLFLWGAQLEDSTAMTEYVKRTL